MQRRQVGTETTLAGLTPREVVRFWGGVLLVGSVRFQETVMSCSGVSVSTVQKRCHQSSSEQGVRHNPFCFSVGSECSFSEPEWPLGVLCQMTVVWVDMTLKVFFFLSVSTSQTHSQTFVVVECENIK